MEVLLSLKIKTQKTVSGNQFLKRIGPMCALTIYGVLDNSLLTKKYLIVHQIIFIPWWNYQKAILTIM